MTFFLNSVLEEGPYDSCTISSVQPSSWARKQNCGGNVSRKVLRVRGSPESDECLWKLILLWALLPASWGVWGGQGQRKRSNVAGKQNRTQECQLNSVQLSFPCAPVDFGLFCALSLNHCLTKGVVPGRCSLNLCEKNKERWGSLLEFLVKVPWTSLSCWSQIGCKAKFIHDPCPWSPFL